MVPEKNVEYLMKNFILITCEKDNIFDILG